MRDHSVIIGVSIPKFLRIGYLKIENVVLEEQERRREEKRGED